jgi:chromosome segregation protein
LFVSQIELRNFKSFPSATIKLQQGFNGIVGPNGCGKSNIIDSLLFAFGENRLKAMRVKRSVDLIFDNNKVAEVKVTLTNGSESHEVARMVKRDGKTKYMLDGKRTKRYAIEDFLSHHSVSTTNIIKQGEVQRIVEMDSKDRRGLIDLVANVSEYEDKKKEAMGELSQVESKLRESTTLMHEREGYLRELEQEKNNAIKYKELKERLDVLKATIIYIDLKNYEASFEALINSMLDHDNKISAVVAKVKELESSITAKNAEKDEINKLIIERSHGEDAELQRAIDALSIGIETSKRTIEEKGASAKEADEKLHSRKLELTKAGDEAHGTGTQLKEIEEELAVVERLLKEKTAEYNRLLGSSNKFSEGFQKAREFVEQSTERMFGIKSQLSELQADAGKNEELARMKEKELDRIKSGEFVDYGPQRKEVEGQRHGLNAKLKEAQATLDGLFERERKLNERVPVLEDLLLMAREKCVEITSRLRTAGEGNERSAEAVDTLRKEDKGVLGTVEELCTYSSRYAVPVQVAFGARSNFVIVDSSKTASRAITALKSRRLGRVSFIPLDKIGTPNLIKKEDRELAERPGALGFLIDLIDFDEKHKRAFEFVCGNTLLMSDMHSCEPLIGKIRMVTMEGELVESSGLMTGGTFTLRVSAAVERRQLTEWEKKRDDAKREKDGAYDALQGLREEMNDARKKKAEAELALKSCEIQLAHMAEQEKRERESKAHVAKALDEIASDIVQLRESVGKSNEERSRLVRELSDLNLKMLEAKQQVDVEKEEAFGIQLKERERAINELRMKYIEYENRLQSLRTQHSLYDKQARSLEKEVAELDAQTGVLRKAVDEADDYIKKARGELKEKTEAQKALSSRFAEMVNKREKIDSEIAKLGNEKGRLEFEREKLEHEAGNERVKKAVVENTLATLKGQMDEFASVTPMDGKGIEHKPELVAHAKVAHAEIESLGSVNMRAVEMYETRAKDFEEQKKRVEQLFTEKEAVITVINAIEGKKVATFMESYNHINSNFKRIFAQIFKGEGTLFLENPERPFDAGLTIQVKLENKEVKYLELMSGGEKSLIALVFMFAVQSVNPSSVYILDEADAALDAENSRKLAMLLHALAEGTQFLVVTHNQNVYKEADTLIGVSAAKEGSRVVEVKLNE